MALPTYDELNTLPSYDELRKGATDEKLVEEYARRGQAAAGGIQGASEMFAADFLGAGLGAVEGLVTSPFREGTLTENVMQESQKGAAQVREAMRMVTDLLPSSEGRNEMADLAQQGMGELIHKGADITGRGLEEYMSQRTAGLSESLLPGFARTAGEVGAQVAPFALMGRGKPQARAKKPPSPEISVREAEQLQRQIEVADSSKLQEFREKAQQGQFDLRDNPELSRFKLDEVNRAIAEIRTKMDLEAGKGQIDLFAETLPEALVLEKRAPGKGDIDFTQELTLQDTAQGVKPVVPELPYTGGEARAGRIVEATEAMGRVEPPATKEVTIQEIQRKFELGGVGRKEGGAVKLTLPEKFGERLTEIASKFKPVHTVGNEISPTNRAVGAAFYDHTKGEIIGPFYNHSSAADHLARNGYRLKDLQDGFMLEDGSFYSRDALDQSPVNARVSESMQGVDGQTYVNWMPDGVGTAIKTFAVREGKMPSGPGAKQGGAFDPEILKRLAERFGQKASAIAPEKSAYESWKDRLPETYRPMAKQLWDQKQKNERLATHQANQGTPHAKAAEVGRIDNDKFANDTRGYEETDFSSVKDIQSTKTGRLTYAGGKMLAQYHNNPALKWGVDQIAAMKDNAEAHVYSRMSDPKSGLLPVLRNLKQKDAENVIHTALEYNGMKNLTPEEMIAHGFSDEQIASYQRLREVLEQTANDLDASRVARGLEPMKREPGYFPASWSGKYFAEVRAPDGRLIAVEHSHRKADLQEIRELGGKNGYKVSEVQERSPVPRGEQGTFKYRPLFDQIAETLGRDSFERVAFDEIVKMYYEEKGYGTRQFGKHFEAKKGVTGYRGTRSHLTPKENYWDALSSLEQYMRDAYEWIETQKALREIQKFDADQATSHLPTVKKALREYWDHAVGTENAMMTITRAALDMSDTLLEKVPLARLGSGSTARGLQMSKELLMMKALGFWRLSFLAPNRLESLAKMPAAILEVYAREPNLPYARGFAEAMFKGQLDSQQYLFTGKGDKLTMAAMEYARTNGVVHPSFISEIRTVRDLRLGKQAWNWVSGAKAINAVEQMARMDAYIMAVRAFEGTRSGEALFSAAKNVTDQAMVNYRTHERAQAFQRMGMVGSSMSPLQAFKFNYFSQQLKFAKLLLDNPTQAAAYAPLLVSMSTMAMFGGLTGLIAIKDADLLIDGLKRLGLIDPDRDNVTSWMLKNTAKLQGKGRDAIRYGMWAGLTGAQTSPHFTMQQIFPHTAEDAMNLPMMGTDLIGDMMESANLLSQGRTKAAGTAAGRALPGPLKAMEEYGRTTSQGLLQDPSKGFEGKVQRNPNMPDPYRMAGTRSVGEAEEMTTAQQNKLKEQIKTQRLTSAAEKMVGQYMEGQNIGPQLKEYYKNGGDLRALMSKMVDTIERSKMTALQSQDMKLKTIRQLRAYMERQEYGLRQGQ